MSRTPTSEKTPRKTVIYDTTLRDGMQGQGISYTLEDKIQIALAMESAERTP